MSLIAGHLEQIALSCEGIDSLPFPPPKIFSNALLSNHDITSLLRDTEPHERALFSVPPPTTTSKPSIPEKSEEKEETATTTTTTTKKRRQTVFNVSSGEVTPGVPPTRSAPRRTAAVAAILGPGMHETLRREGEGSEVDVEVLLRGAEKLCGVYEMPGALGRIQSLRGKWAGLEATLAYYEGRVAEQAEQLEAMSRMWREENEYEDGYGGGGYGGEGDEGDESEIMTLEELRVEEEEVKELEGRKRELQERLRAMERDIGGLRAM